MIVCKQWRTVDILPALNLLPFVSFGDTGGTNGWIAKPEWLPAFIRTLNLGGLIVYAVCRKLPAGQGIPPHIDDSKHKGSIGRRFHIPLVTHPAVTMRWPREHVEMHLVAGSLYEVRFDILHEVVNNAPIDRTHIQVNIQYPDLPDMDLDG